MNYFILLYNIIFKKEKNYARAIVVGNNEPAFEKVKSDEFFWNLPIWTKIQKLDFDSLDFLFLFWYFAWIQMEVISLFRFMCKWRVNYKLKIDGYINGNKVKELIIKVVEVSLSKRL